MDRLDLESEESYYELLRGGIPRIVEAELRNLLNLVTVTETCFFRDAAQFLLFRERIVPALIAEGTSRPAGNRTLRIWSAGCSTGDEAYSVAMTLDDMGFFLTYPDLRVEIIGTDLNSEALEKAQLAAYSERSVRNVEGRLLDRYFDRDGKTYQLKDEIRNRVRFEFGNLMQTPMPSTGPQDVIFCKNVAIYFPSDVTRKLVQGLHETISPGGYLLLGHSESLWHVSEDFDIIEHERAFCYQKRRGFRVPGSEFQVRGSDFRVHGSEFRVPGSAFGVAGVPGTLGYAAAQYDICLALFRASEWSVAESALLGLIRTCPTFVPSYLLLGGVYVHRARYDEAVKQAESALRLTELEPRAHLLLGMIASRSGRPEEALQSLERALCLDDSLALAHFWLGNLYRDRGDIARACREYESVVRDWEQRTLQLTEEFALELTAEQLVKFCSDSLQRLSPVAGR